MKKKIIILAIMAILLTPILSLNLSAEKVDTVEIYGVSYKEGGTIFKSHITESSKTAFPFIDWYIYALEDSTLIYICDGEEILNENITPGLHYYNFSYEDGNHLIKWKVNDEVKSFSFKITTSNAEFLEEEDKDFITITAEELRKIEINTALGCIALTLIPSIFMIPFWKKRRGESIDEIL